MLTVRINRKKWLRGEGAPASQLYRKSDEKMCCIGFLALKLGAKKNDMQKCDVLSEVDIPECKTFASDQREALTDAYDTNDAEAYDTSKEREKDLKKIGKEMGVNFVFFN